MKLLQSLIPRRQFGVLLAGLIMSLAGGLVEGAESTGRAQTLPGPEQADCDRSDFQKVLAPDAPGNGAIEARAFWLNRHLIQWPGANKSGTFRLYHSPGARIVASAGRRIEGADGWLEMSVFDGQVPAQIASRFKFVAAGAVLTLRDGDSDQLRKLHRQQWMLVREDAEGKVIEATALQSAGALDDLFAAAAAGDLGVSVSPRKTHFNLWAPTAQQVSLCIYRSGAGASRRMVAMQPDSATGIWSLAVPADLSGNYFTYLVDVYVPGTGIVRNRVTDPYSISLTTDSIRSYVENLNSRRLKPAGWDGSRSPARVRAQTDMMIYELHVRDFSINDRSVPAAHRGKYAAFTQGNSHGMKHLKALSRAGMTDVHLLPVFDFATVPEVGCVAPDPGTPSQAPDGEAQQSVVTAVRDRDCFNWGYDPLHYTAPEGSYASSAADGARRIVEFRQMVMALHRAGLRVGMDVVYNHTSASGQREKSVLDRIVPGYYQRLNAAGKVENSTCCDNTSTENMMMAKLMIDSVLTWAREYKIDSFRFDLMGHQPRSVMLELQRRLAATVGRDVQLIGEGWNFGEVADGARFEQASQLSLNGTGIGTFNDRLRDAVRGGGAADKGEELFQRQGYINGMVYDRNERAGNIPDKGELMRTADMVRSGLAGSLRHYPLKTWRDEMVVLQNIDYGGQPAGYVSEPAEVVNYVENHDNQTLFDINAFRLPPSTSHEDRARVQILGLAINAFSQGVAYFHAGVDILRSKSLDRNSYDSGDWFNRLDWTYRDNYFGTGAPPKIDNGADYLLIKPLLSNPAIRPTAREIAWTRDAFLDLLRIRSSTTLFRMAAAHDIKSRLTFFNTGSRQLPTLLAGHLNGDGYTGAAFREVLYLVNVDKIQQALVIPAMQRKNFVLHPVHLAPSAADKRVSAAARFDAASGEFVIPARSAVVFVVQ